jgi:hypothetical protein
VGQRKNEEINAGVALGELNIDAFEVKMENMPAL